MQNHMSTGKANAAGLAMLFMPFFDNSFTYNSNFQPTPNANPLSYFQWIPLPKLKNGILLLL